MEGGHLEGGNQSGTVPEDKSNDVESHGLGQGEDQVTPESSPVGTTERSLERLAVDPAAVILTSEGGDSTDRTGSLASQLS